MWRCALQGQLELRERQPGSSSPWGRQLCSPVSSSLLSMEVGHSLSLQSAGDGCGD